MQAAALPAAAPDTVEHDLVLLNRALQAHRDYRPGMRFVAVASGACGRSARWYTWEPPLMHPFIEASAAVPAEYVLGPMRHA